MKLISAIVKLSSKVSLDKAKKAFLKRELGSVFQDETLTLEESSEGIANLIDQVTDIKTWEEIQDMCFEYNDEPDSDEDFDSWILELAK